MNSDPTQNLIDAIYIEKVLRARRQSLEVKFLCGTRLLVYAKSATLSGIRAQHPQLCERQARTELARRLAISRRLDGEPA